jgi:fermentation-respiration switch protein FrsA (DUF1100 family)
VLIAFGLVLALIYFGQRRLIYFPFGGVPSPGELGLEQAEPVEFTTADGLRLHGWFVPAAAPPARATVIVFNGNGGHRGLRAPLAAALAARGIATLLFDYRGYGENPGSPSEAGLIADARAARDHIARREPDAARIFYFGESLGAAVAVQIAVEHPPAGLILRSPFTSLADIGRHHYPILPVGWLLRDRYPSIDLIGRVKAPLLVVAGAADRIIPAEDSKRLYAAAPDPKRLVVIDGADHNDYELLAGARLVEAVARFIDPMIR